MLEISALKRHSRNFGKIYWNTIFCPGALTLLTSDSCRVDVPAALGHVLPPPLCCSDQATSPRNVSPSAGSLNPIPIARAGAQTGSYLSLHPDDSWCPNGGHSCLPLSLLPLFSSTRCFLQPPFYLLRPPTPSIPTWGPTSGALHDLQSSTF